jgi:hypothetical protein
VRAWRCAGTTNNCSGCNCSGPITATTLLDGSSMNVGLVTDISGVNVQSFNQLAWVGVRPLRAPHTNASKLA